MFKWGIHRRERREGTHYNLVMSSYRREHEVCSGVYRLRIRLGDRDGYDVHYWSIPKTKVRNTKL